MSFGSMHPELVYLPPPGAVRHVHTIVQALDLDAGGVPDKPDERHFRRRVQYVQGSRGVGVPRVQGEEWREKGLHKNTGVRSQKAWRTMLRGLYPAW